MPRQDRARRKDVAYGKLHTELWRSDRPSWCAGSRERQTCNPIPWPIIDVTEHTAIP